MSVAPARRSLSHSLQQGSHWCAPRLPHQQCRRHESSYRRTNKKLRVKPDSSYLLSATSPQRDHIIFNPPSSAPSVLQTPLKFLPKTDPRRTLFAASGLHSSVVVDQSVKSPQLPPPVRKPYEKSYHLTEKEVEEIRTLRTSDPEVWTRQKLAKRFNCSSLFVGMVCEASKEQKQRQAQKLEDVKARWGPRRRTAREDRARRRAAWGRDE
ncbi:MAG: hypothetical protein M1824_004299 [Vezdaea acicularis]|nr:MAG: hypothetical protein M1824_004299 [Vezdaea acicularis]